MAASVLSVRVDSSIKDSFAELCEELGMTSSVAVNMFMRQNAARALSAVCSFTW